MSVIALARVRTGGPRRKLRIRIEYDTFLEYLHRACPPDAFRVTPERSPK